MEASARELRLRLDACRAQDAEAGGARHGLLEQRGLPDPRLAPHHECARPTASRRGHEGVDAVELVGAPDEHVLNRTPRRAAVI